MKKRLIFFSICCFSAVIMCSCAPSSLTNPQKLEICKFNVESLAQLVSERGIEYIKHNPRKLWYGRYLYFFDRISNSKIVEDGYMWIHTLDGIIVVHPIHPELNGSKCTEMEHVNCFKVISEMNKIAEEYGGGWVKYEMPRPFMRNPVSKISYVKLVEKDGKKYVVGSGVYNVTMSEVKGHFFSDPTTEILDVNF